MAVEAGASELVKVVALLGAAVVAGAAVPPASGLARCWATLAAGLAIGPFGFRLILRTPQAVLHVGRAGRRHVPVRHRAGDAARARLWSLRKEIFGLGFAADRGLRHGADRRLHAVRFSAAGGLHRRGRFRVDLYRRSDAAAGRAQRQSRCRRGRRSSPSCCSKTCLSCRCWRVAAFMAPVRTADAESPARVWLSVGIRYRRRAIVGYGAGRPVPAESGLPHPGRYGARGDDRRRTSGCLGAAWADAAGRAVDGHGRLPCRGAAVGIHLPPPDWRPTSNRSAASCWACSSSASACRWTWPWCRDWPIVLAASRLHVRQDGGVIYDRPHQVRATARPSSARP
jgi:hypothetical protein